MSKHIVLAAIVAALAATPALGFSRCRLSPQECRIIAQERHRLAVVAAYERSIPSSRPPIQQGWYLNDRHQARLIETVSRMPKRMGEELARMTACDAVDELEIAGGDASKFRRDCP